LVNETFDYVQYLDLKKSIDDRSLNKNVWEVFSSWLREKIEKEATLSVLEIGAGVGTMIERLLESSLLEKCHYIALEPEASFKEAALNRLESWSSRHNWDFEISSEDLWQIRNQQSHITVQWLKANAEEIEVLFEEESFDLLLSHAVIDLLPVPEIMPDVLMKLKKQGAFYFSLNFSGSTEFFPEYEMDAEISEKYHADMDSRFPESTWQPSMTGHNLLKWLEDYGCHQLVDGESDWNLSPTDQLFIGNILDTIKKALAGLPGLEQWLVKRYKELHSGELELRISNRDCFGLK